MHGGATASLVDLVGSAVFYTAGVETRGAPLEMSIAYLDAAFADVFSIFFLHFFICSYGIFVTS
jgi:acyl-coenzyme A thioesterase PaaI-like protein